MAVEIDGDGSGGTSPSRQGDRTEIFCPPNLPFGGVGAAELFVENVKPLEVFRSEGFL